MQVWTYVGNEDLRAATLHAGSTESSAETATGAKAGSSTEASARSAHATTGTAGCVKARFSLAVL